MTSTATPTQSWRVNRVGAGGLWPWAGPSIWMSGTELVER